MRFCVPLINDPADLPTDLNKAHELLLSQDSHIRALATAVERLQKMLYGPKSERVPQSGDGQLDAFVEDAKTEIDSVPSVKPGEEPAKRRNGHSRRRIAADLPRRRLEHDVTQQEKVCAGCGCEKKRIGEEVSEQLDYVPAQLEVIEHVRFRYACPSCRDGVVEAARPSQPIEKGLAASGLLAHVVISKYADHMPLTRQERIFSRHGLDLPRTTLCDWVMQCADLVKPLYEAMKKLTLQSAVIHTDDTPVPVLQKDHTHRAFLWVYVGDEAHPITVYDFTWNRSRAGPNEFLKGYKGHLQADAYPGYEDLYRSGEIFELGCWAHARRKFIEAQNSDGVYAPEAVRRIGALYGIEQRARELSCEQRRDLRQAESVALLEELFAWMEHAAFKVLPKSPTGEALNYAINNCIALKRYVEDGRFDIDNNEAERALRSVVIGRKNWMFAGSQRGGEAAAIFFSLIESCRRNQVNVFAWMRDLFTRLPDHPITRLDEFFPHNWKQQHTDTAA